MGLQLVMGLLGDISDQHNVQEELPFGKNAFHDLAITCHDIDFVAISDELLLAPRTFSPSLSS